MKLILLLFLVFTIVSCSKERSTSVSGTVKDFYSNQPISNYIIQLEEVTSSLIFTTTNILDTLITDNEGQFYADFDYPQDLASVRLNSTPTDNYYSFQPEISQIGESNEYNLLVKPYQLLKIEIQDTSDKYNHYRLFLDPQKPSPYPELMQNDTTITRFIVPDDSIHLSFYCYTDSLTYPADSFFIRQLFFPFNNESSMEIKF